MASSRWESIDSDPIFLTDGRVTPDTTVEEDPYDFTVANDPYVKVALEELAKLK
jgi:hypothetical protein